MRAVAALVGLVLLSIPVGAFQESVKTAKMSLQGTWALKDVRVNDEEETKRIAKKMKGTKVTFSGDKVTVKAEGKDQTGSYRVDPSKSPKEMDWIMKTPDNKEVVMRGIYEHKGNRLTTCFGGVTADRPVKEKGKDKGDGGSKRPGSLKPTGGAILMRFEREKP